MAVRSAPAPTRWLGLLGLLAVLLLWWLGSAWWGLHSGLAGRFSPLATWHSLLEIFSGSDIWLHIGASLRRVLIGLALALLIGVPLGLAVGSWRTLETASSPAFQFLRMISPLSWMPIAVMVLGVGDAPIYFLLTFAAVWPVMLNTAAGVRKLDTRWLQLARSMAATRGEMLRHVILPGVFSHVLTGVRLAIGILWIVLVPCEMLGVSEGLGYFILDTRDRLAYSELMAMVLVIGALGYALDACARALYRRWASD